MLTGHGLLRPLVVITELQVCSRWSKLVCTAVAEFPRAGYKVGLETSHHVVHIVGMKVNHTERQSSSLIIIIGIGRRRNLVK